MIQKQRNETIQVVQPYLEEVENIVRDQDERVERAEGKLESKDREQK